jgi:D-lactate dehydrogenase (cytochrome)
MLKFYIRTFRKEKIEHVIFGHIGENHLHVNMLPRSQAEAVKADTMALSFIRKSISLGGTVSAEHGIGKLKHRYLQEMYGSRGILEMARIKKAFDPNRILGLDNIFPREVLA